jgi:hypothetical protein
MTKDKEKPLNIYQRINAVMNEVEYIQKQEKRVNNQYRFVSHDQVTGRLHSPLTKHGIVMVPSIASVKQDGNRTEIMVNVKFVNIDEPSDFVSVDYLGYGIDVSDKGPGKAISYACKYALLKMFCLETGDDPDQDQDSKHESSDELDGCITKEQLYELGKLTDKCSDEFMQRLYTHFKFNSLSKLKKEYFDSVYKRMLQEQEKIA